MNSLKLCLWKGKLNSFKLYITGRNNVRTEATQKITPKKREVYQYETNLVVFFFIKKINIQWSRVDLILEDGGLVSVHARKYIL